ncbi:MAG: hypothetical protein ACLUNO_10680 [Oscillospiraceae bacterium]
MLVNLESGSFTDVPQSAFDKALDAASTAPGAYRFEKMTSGRYLGELSRLALIAAANDGLFAPETADKLCALDTLSAADADAFGADPDCGAIAALAAAAADADRKTAAMVIQGVFGRAAKAIVANIAAIVFLTDGAKNRYRPMVVAVDGSLFRYSTPLRPAVSEELEAFLVQNAPALLRVQTRAERLRHRYGRRVPAAGLKPGAKKPDVCDIRLFCA